MFGLTLFLLLKPYHYHLPFYYQPNVTHLIKATFTRLYQQFHSTYQNISKAAVLNRSGSFAIWFLQNVTMTRSKTNGNICPFVRRVVIVFLPQKIACLLLILRTKAGKELQKNAQSTQSMEYRIVQIIQVQENASTIYLVSLSLLFY